MIEVVFGCASIVGVLALFGAAWWIYYPGVLIDFLLWALVFFSKFKRHVLVHEERKLSYIESQNKHATSSTVIFLHGYSGEAADWLVIWKRISSTIERNHVVALDLLNHGQSESDDKNPVTIDNMINFIKQFVRLSGLHGRQIHLVGYSMGGFLSVKYASAKDLPINSLLLFCPAGGKLNHSEHTLRTKGLDIYADNAELWAAFRQGGFQEKPNYVIMTSIRHRMNKRATLRQKVYEGFASFKGVAVPTIEETPAMLVWGREDNILPMKEGVECYKKHLSNILEIRVVENCGHVIPILHQNEAAACIEQWTTKQ